MRVVLICRITKTDRIEWIYRPTRIRCASNKLLCHFSEFLLKRKTSACQRKLTKHAHFHRFSIFLMKLWMLCVDSILYSALKKYIILKCVSVIVYDTPKKKKRKTEWQRISKSFSLDWLNQPQQPNEMLCFPFFDCIDKYEMIDNFQFVVVEQLEMYREREDKLNKLPDNTFFRQFCWIFFLSRCSPHFSTIHFEPKSVCYLSYEQVVDQFVFGRLLMLRSMHRTYAFVACDVSR